MSNVKHFIPKDMNHRPTQYDEIESYLNRMYYLYDECNHSHLELLLFSSGTLFGTLPKPVLLPHASRIFKLFNQVYTNLASMDLTSTIIPQFNIMYWNDDVLDISVRIVDVASEDLIAVWRFAIINELDDEIRLGRHDHDIEMSQFRRDLFAADDNDPRICRLASKQYEAFKWFRSHCTGNDKPQPRNAFMTLFDYDPDNGKTNKFYTYGYATYLPIAGTEHYLLAEVTFPKIK